MMELDHRHFSPRLPFIIVTHWKLGRGTYQGRRILHRFTSLVYIIINQVIQFILIK